MRGRPGLRFVAACGDVAAAFFLALLLATVAGPATSIVSALASTAATGFVRNCPNPLAFANASLKSRKFSADDATRNAYFCRFAPLARVIHVGAGCRQKLSFTVRAIE